MKTLKEISGCCLSHCPMHEAQFSHDTERKVLFNLFSVCGVEFPEVCEGFPDDGILDCAYPSPIDTVSQQASLTSL